VAQTPAQQNQNLETVKRVYDAYGARDVDGLLAPLHDDFEISQTDQLPWGDRYKGRDGMMEYIKNITTIVDSALVVEEMFEAGDNVIVIGRATGTVKSSGRQYDVRLTDVCKVREGKVLSIDIYIDTPATLEALAE
jgi:ketosteroid isomerase-like protein